jgi:hypothetical protein
MRPKSADLRKSDMEKRMIGLESDELRANGIIAPDHQEPSGLSRMVPWGRFGTLSQCRTPISEAGAVFTATAPDRFG